MNDQSMKRGGLALVFEVLLAAWMLIGCRSGPSLVQVDVSEPGWTMVEGQAVWRTRSGAPEIVAEFQGSFHSDGRRWLEVSKAGLPFMTVRADSLSWEIRTSMRKQRFAGRGAPTHRSGWLQLSTCLAGQRPARQWAWVRRADGGWRLSNASTGEQIEGVTTP